MATFDKEANALGQAATAPRLPVRGGLKWFFGAHPESFEVAEVDGVLRWLPQLRKLPFIKGAGGIRENGDTGPYTTWLNAQGWTLIDNNRSPKHWLHYADSFPGRGGVVTIDVWTTVHQPTPNKIKLRREPEQAAAYDRWRARLIDEGVVDAPDPIIIDDMIDDFEHQTIRRLMGKEQRPIIAQKLEKARADLANMKAAVLTAPEPATTPAPKRRRNG